MAKVLFSKNFVPVAAFLSADKSVDFVFSETASEAVLEGNNVTGNFAVAHALAQSAPHAAALLGKSGDDQKQVQEWLNFATNSLHADKDLNSFGVAVSQLNHHLLLRTYFVGHCRSLADLVVYEALKNNAKWMGVRNRCSAQLLHLIRWFTALEQEDDISEANKTLFNAIKKKSSTSAVSVTQQQAVKKDNNNNAKAAASTASSSGNNAQPSPAGTATFDELPHAVYGQVCTRFPPEASGFLHIGHAKAAIINQYYARRYAGVLLFRFDDTNPEKEKCEYEQSILDDLKNLGFQADKSSYTSDHFDLMIKLATDLIKSGHAYCDQTPTEELRKLREKKQESKYRNNSVEENIKLWNEMLKGTDEGKKTCLRAKIDMASENGAMRDPILYRCNSHPHPKTKDKYKCYPTYDFACPVVDSVEGVTHAFRTNEYHDRNAQYYWVCDALGLRKPHIEDFSRLNMRCSLMSKRKLTWFVNEGLVEGWDDPRFPTVQGLLRRGLTVEALKEFIECQGTSKNINWMEWEKLWKINVRILDPIVPRYTAVYTSKMVPIELTNGPQALEYKTIAKHKKNPSLGNKSTVYANKIYINQEDAVLIKEGEEVTLMDWGNCFITKIEKEGDAVVKMIGTLNPQGDVKKTKYKLTWLSDAPDTWVQADLVEYGHIITKDKLEEEDKVENFVNKNSKTVRTAIGDGNLRQLQKGDKIQLERLGYFICDRPYINKNKPMVLINIPDSKKKD